MHLAIIAGRRKWLNAKPCALFRQKSALVIMDLGRGIYRLGNVGAYCGLHLVIGPSDLPGHGLHPRSKPVSCLKSGIQPRSKP
jgi:hypothetical protein